VPELMSDEDAADGRPQPDPPAPPHPARRREGSLGVLTLAALGVVFGDIGTSPLYALRTAFAIDHDAVRATTSDVYGVISLVFWSITLVVTVKYVGLVLRADNGGEGGVMTLVALVRRALIRSSSRRAMSMVLLGVAGASLFYGDSVITPAISVLSAVEGTRVAAPGLADLTVPIAVGILVVLFAVQRFGTGPVGRLFGPVMLVWFVVLAAVGIPPIVRDPAILRALSPSYGAVFIVDRPYTAFLSMGAVVLAITGAEALYADLGHFGRRPITLAWLCAVFPALTVNYLGQGALIVRTRADRTDPLFLMVPSWSRGAFVVLATIATIIASQAVITGAFSVSRQAVRLGLLPHLTIRHTSRDQAGQVYLPVVNWLLFVLVILVVLGFRSSAGLATAYGVAVTGTFLVTTVLFLVIARALWGWPRWQIACLAVLFGSVEITYFLANLTKIAHGGWLPLVVAATIFALMTTWQKGHRILATRRTELEGPLEAFVRALRDEAITRVPGTAVFAHVTVDTTPLALRANVELNHVVHEQVVILAARTADVPHVPWPEALQIDHLGDPTDGVVRISVTFGFLDPTDLPEALRRACGEDIEGAIDPDEASYFLSRVTLHCTSAAGMSRWRKRIFVAMARNAASQAESLHLPEERTISMSHVVDL
jgi:KUP system potassium uptake protein